MEGLPAEATEEMLEDDAFMKKFHHALLEVHLQEGALVCPETGACGGGWVGPRWCWAASTGGWPSGQGHMAARLPQGVARRRRTRLHLRRRAPLLQRALLPPNACPAPPAVAAAAPPALPHPLAGRKFPVSAGIPNLLLTEDEC